ncbi:MAG: ABC transporter substrate-binding protein [Bacteroidales bacterium]
MKKLNWVIILISMLGMFSCNNLSDQTNEHISTEKRIGVCEINYAQGFKIEYFKDFKLITIKDPWQGAEGVEFRYALAENIDSLPQLPDDIVKIKIPIEKIACLSTTHIAFIDALNKTNSIRAISGHKYVCNQHIRKGIAENKIGDVGYDNSLNYELIAGIKPDLVTTYGIDSQVATYNQRMNELGIKTVIIAEYLENHPLGKFEWIKLVAAFYNLDDFASDYFNTIEKQYNNLLSITKKVESKPTVLFGLPWKEVWYVPGGNSYLAKLVEDAGGDYIWKKDKSRESLTLNFESIFLKASNSDIWLNTGTVNKINEIVDMDERFKKFKPISNAKIFNNNAITNEYGGIDYWESGIVNPHIILKDMIAIFHPELIKDYQPVYYKKIE